MVFHITRADREIIRKHTPWIVSPVDGSITSDGNDSDKSVTEGDENPTEDTPNLRTTTQESNKQRREDGIPVFKSHPRAGPIELFYDLFFVANLTTFTKNHEVANAETLKSYIGFFSLMWFTWLETALFDVRFSHDSVFDRVCKAVAFGVMTGFAVVSPEYQTDLIDDADPSQDTSFAFKAMALILVASRLALVVQYGVVSLFVKDYRKATIPFLCSMGIHFIAAMVFLGTYWGFPENGNSSNPTYAAWYAIVPVEAFAMIAVAVRWHEVGFKHTNLIERVGLLTLIVMGEGVIGMTQSVGTILQNLVRVSGQTIGTIVAAILLIYFVWILYFDQLDDDRFGSLRQPFWAIFHFPLHVTILLTLEGSTQLIIWDQILQSFHSLRISSPSLQPGETAAQYARMFGEHIITFNEQFRTKNFSTYYNYTQNLTAMAKLDVDTKAGLQQFVDIRSQLRNGLFQFIFTNFDISAPDNSDGDSSISEQSAALIRRFTTVFIYFFIASGLFLVVLGSMYYVGTRNIARMEYAAVAVRVLSGIGLSLLTIIIVTPAVTPFLLSAWIIPTVVLVYFTVIFLDNLLMWLWASMKFGEKTVREVEDGI